MTLLTTPVVYVVLDKLRRKRKREDDATPLRAAAVEGTA
jgi:hypothetical protein